MSDDLCFLTIAEASKAIAARKLSPVELTRAHLDRIARINPKVHAFITVTAERAMDDARRAAAEIASGRYRGPLHGIPYSLKDNIETDGILTTGNSRLLIDSVPAKDATCAALMREAGGVLLGKVALREFALGTRHEDLPWPYPINPWNRGYEFTGGSSTGSAVAVAAGMSMVSIGTDTGGSVRNPAGMCGLAGIKPTYGLVSRAGVIPNTFTLDSVGPLARTAEDCALTLQAIAAYDSADLGSARAAPQDYSQDIGRDIRGLRIGVLRDFHESVLAPDKPMRAAFDRAVEALRSLGAEVVDARLAPLTEYHACKVMLTLSEFYAVHERDLHERPHLFGRKLVMRALAGAMVSAADYLQAQRMRLKLARDMMVATESFDALLTLTTFAPAALDDPNAPSAAVQQPAPTMPFSISGFPAIAVGTGFDPNGLPLSMQIAARPFEEPKLFRIASAYEKAAGWIGRRPAL